jgi:hypothetical protein
MPAKLLTRSPVWHGFAIVMAIGAPARPVGAQAWVAPAGTGAVTFVAQQIDHVGRMRNDGTRAPVGKSENFGVGIEVDYAFTDRWSISLGLPFVVSRFTDPNPPPPFVPFPAADACRCWRQEFQDFGVATRFNVVDINRTFMLTPFVGVTLPSHAYDYVGEAVVGRRLKELKLGAYAGHRLDNLLKGAAVEAGYAYSVVERVLDVPNNRSNGSGQLGFALGRGWSTRFITSWQRTHGGLRFPMEVNVPEIPERLTEYHRMLRDNYLHTGGGVTYSRGRWGFSGSTLFTARGSNSHDVHVFSVTASRAFEIGTR